MKSESRNSLSYIFTFNQIIDNKYSFFHNNDGKIVYQASN